MHNFFFFFGYLQSLGVTRLCTHPMSVTSSCAHACCPQSGMELLDLIHAATLYHHSGISAQQITNTLLFVFTIVC